MEGIGIKQFSNLIGLVGQELDVPQIKQDLAKQRYEMLGAWLAEDHKTKFQSDARIYPQGSFRLGTAIRPIRADDGYDVDLVYRRDIAKTSITREKLKQDLGEQLGRYIQHLGQSSEKNTQLSEGKRCWTLDFDDDFHMDILPAIPDENAPVWHEELVGIPLMITDKAMGEWQSSNPEGLALWFGRMQGPLLHEQKELIAREAAVDIESIPDYRVPTPLRQAVQLFKRHRDISFSDRPDDKPASIIITTLAALAYNNEGEVYSAITAIADKMRTILESTRKNGAYFVVNPTNPSENFADRWIRSPDSVTHFMTWLEKVETDLNLALAKSGMHEVSASLSEAFGESPVLRAFETYGHQMRELRDAGKLRMATPSGTIGTSGKRKVPYHTNYGHDSQAKSA